MKTSEQLFSELREAIVDCLMVPNEWLPESYQGKRKMRKLRSVVNQAKRENKQVWRDGREVSVKFDGDRNITFARDERLACLEKYAASVEAGEPIKYDENEDRLYNHMLAFCSGAVRSGMMEGFEDNE